MLSDAERERLIKEIQDAHQRALEDAYGVGKSLLLIKEHEPRETFIEILKRFGFTEIEGEAICKHMRQDGAVEAAERIGEIMMKSVMRWLEGNDE